MNHRGLSLCTCLHLHYIPLIKMNFKVIQGNIFLMQLNKESCGDTGLDTSESVWAGSPGFFVGRGIQI